MVTKLTRKGHGAFMMRLGETSTMKPFPRLHLFSIKLLGKKPSMNFDDLTRALMGSGELHVLRGVAQRASLRIFKSKSCKVKIQTALERPRQTLQDTIMLTLFFYL